MNVLNKRREYCNIGFTNGCFDLLHVGHIDSIHRLACVAGFVVVAVNSDESAHRLKGDGHPVIPLQQRIQLLAALDDVDMVIPFDEAFPLALIKAVMPKVLLKGAEYKEEQIVGVDFVQSYGGYVVRAPMVSDVSTSKIIERIKEKC